MIKSGKPLTVFGVRNEDLSLFVKEAKRYGVVYCALRNPKDYGDGMTDIIVRQEDASRINRIVERFNLAIVDTAAIKTDILKSREGKGMEGHTEGSIEKPTPEAEAKDDALLDDLFGDEETPEREVKALPKESDTPSGPSSTKPRDGDTSKDTAEKPSVRRELHLIKEAQEKSREKQPGISKGQETKKYLKAKKRNVDKGGRTI